MPRFRHGAAEAHAIEPYADTPPKLGRVATTSTSTDHSCPPLCPLRRACFFRHGLHTGRLDNELRKASEGATPLEVAYAEANGIDELRGNVPLRLHIGGDCRTTEAAEVVSRAAARYSLRWDQPVWTFTHGWRDPHRVQRSAWGLISALASCETLDELDLVAAMGYAPALTVQAHPADGKAWKWKDWRIVPCLEQTGRAQSCESCRSCFDDSHLKSSRTAVAFQLHGPPKAIKAAPPLERSPGAKIESVKTNVVELFEEKKPRRYTCGNCERKGHNSRKCPEPPREPPAPPSAYSKGPKGSKLCVDCQQILDHTGPEIVCLKCLVVAISNDPRRGGAHWAFSKLVEAMARPDLKVKAVGIARIEFPGRWRAHRKGKTKVERRVVPVKPRPPEPEPVKQIPREPEAEPAPEPRPPPQIEAVKHEPEPPAMPAPEIETTVVRKGKSGRNARRRRTLPWSEFIELRDNGTTPPTHEREEPMPRQGKKCDTCGESFVPSGKQKTCNECLVSECEDKTPSLGWARRLEGVAVRDPEFQDRIHAIFTVAKESNPRVRIPGILKRAQPKKAKKKVVRKKAKKRAKAAKKRTPRSHPTRHETNLADAVATDVAANEFDEELRAMAAVYNALEPLLNASRERVLLYVFDRLDFSL